MARSTIHAWMMESVWRREEKGGGKGKGSERGGGGGRRSIKLPRPEFQA